MQFAFFDYGPNVDLSITPFPLLVNRVQPWETESLHCTLHVITVVRLGDQILLTDALTTLAGIPAICVVFRVQQPSKQNRTLYHFHELWLLQTCLFPLARFIILTPCTNIGRTLPVFRVGEGRVRYQFLIKKSKIAPSLLHCYHWRRLLISNAAGLIQTLSARWTYSSCSLLDNHLYDCPCQQMTYHYNQL